MVLHDIIKSFDMGGGGGEWSVSDLEGKMWGDGKNVSHPCSPVFCELSNQNGD